MGNQCDGLNDKALCRVVLIFCSQLLFCAVAAWGAFASSPADSAGSVYRLPAKADSVDITAEFQALIDKIDSGTVLVNPGSYEVSDVIRINGKSNLTIQFEPGALVRTRKHGYGIIELTDSSRIRISGGKLEGAGSFLPKNYGNQAGGGEKQATIATWGYRRNGEPNRHGTHNGGYIGNIGIAILIRYGCSDVTIENVEISGFNYAGVQAGFLGDKDHLQAKYSRNITVRNCFIHDNYNCGITVHAAEDVRIENNMIERIGHPDAAPDDYEINPGYGVAVSLVKQGGAHGKRVQIIGNRVRYIARKGIDAHSGEDLVIRGNHVEDALVVGISLKGSSGVGRKAVIEENTVVDCGTADGAKVDAKIGISTAFPDTQVLRNNIINSGKGYSLYCEAARCQFVGNQVLSDKFVTVRPLYARGYGDTVIQGVDISNNRFRGKFKSPLMLKNIANSKFESNILAYEDKSLKLYELVNCNLDVRSNTDVDR